MDLQVVGEAGDNVSAQLAVGRLQPHVVLLDLSMPECDSIVTIQRLKREFPDVVVLAMSGHAGRPHQAMALNAGAMGFLSKSAPADLWLKALRTVARGAAYVAPGWEEAASDTDRPALSERELVVLKMLAAGHPAKEVAQTLSISVRTMETYRERAMKKRRLKSRVDIVRHAAQHGWLGLA